MKRNQSGEKMTLVSISHEAGLKVSGIGGIKNWAAFTIRTCAPLKYAIFEVAIYISFSKIYKP
jgi:hypothetical protein